MWQIVKIICVPTGRKSNDVRPLQLGLVAILIRRTSALDYVRQRLSQFHRAARQFGNYFSYQSLLWVAVIGNTLGSLTTYVLGRWLPAFNKPPQNAELAWTLEKTQRYGSLVLFFSWLPIIGDVFCAVAGWLRLNWLACLVFIALGKIVRYVFLLFLGVAFL